MTAIVPQSDIRLLKVPLEIDNMNQLTFTNITAQTNYFNTLPHLTFDDFTYQRKDGILRIPALIDDILEYNYVMYRNDAYSEKWFYAYIDKMEYLNDHVTAVSISTDCWQTWQFDLRYKKTFVEREHVNDDTVGIHTIPENVELGEYEIYDIRNIPLYERPVGELGDAWLPCFCVTKLPSDTTNTTTEGRVAGDVGYVGGVFSSLIFFVAQTLTAGAHIIDIYDNDPDLTSDAIVNVFMVPRCCVNILTSGASLTHGYALYPLYNFYLSDEIKIQQPQKLSGNYTPVNKKLLTWPYSYFYVSNKAGEDVTFKYEDFPFETVSSNYARTITYQIGIVPSASLSAKVYFTKYKNYVAGNTYGTQLYGYGVNFGKVPVCAWSTDYYTNWLTQNGINMAVDTTTSLIGSGLGLAASAVTGNAIGAITSGVNIGKTIGDAVGEIHKASSTPPQAHGDVNTGDFGFCFSRCAIQLFYMSIRPEMSKVIDDYFSMYGYKVNSVKTPNITGRRNWNFVKTIGCYIDADIPQEDLQTIKSMFDNGVTFWHNASTFADYSQNNDII